MKLPFSNLHGTPREFCQDVILLFLLGGALFVGGILFLRECIQLIS